MSTRMIAAAPRTRATPAPGRRRTGPPARPVPTAPGGYSGWAGGDVRDQWRRTPYGYPDSESVPYVDAEVDAYLDASPDPAPAPAGAAPLLIEPLAGSLLRLRWLGTDSTAREVVLLLADAQRRPLVSQTVRERPYIAIFERTLRAAFIGVTVVHADGASTTTLVPLPVSADDRDR